MDLGDQADQAWLLSVQRKLYQWSRTHPEDSYRDLCGTGLQTSATCGAPGRKSLSTKGVVLPGSTG
jgi:hypothetical protein